MTKLGVSLALLLWCSACSDVRNQSGQTDRERSQNSSSSSNAGAVTAGPEATVAGASGGDVTGTDSAEIDTSQVDTPNAPEAGPTDPPQTEPQQEDSPENTTSDGAQQRDRPDPDEGDIVGNIDPTGGISVGEDSCGGLSDCGVLRPASPEIEGIRIPPKEGPPLTDQFQQRVNRVNPRLFEDQGVGRELEQNRIHDDGFIRPQR